jgi:hypothetical protein
LWVVSALVVLVLAALTVWALDPFAGNSSDASGSSSASSSSAATRPTTQSSAPTSAETGQPSAATSAAPAPAPAPVGGAVRAQDVDKAVKDFFNHVPKDLQAAYQLTSPGFQGRFSYASFSGFWSGFKDVKVSNIQTQEASTKAAVNIEYVRPDGTRQTEHHVLTFVAGNAGQLLMDSDVQG